MRRPLLYAAIAAVVALTVAFSIYSFGKAVGENALLRQSLESKDYQAAYESLLIDSPDIEERPFLGESEAPLTLVFIVDFSSEFSAGTYEQKAPALKASYVDNGQARLYHKYQITRQDYESRSERYLKSAAAFCYEGNDTIGFHIALSRQGPEAAASLLGADWSEMGACMSSEHVPLLKDVLETEQFFIKSPSVYIGIDGRDNTVLYGNPGWDLLGRAMRSKQIKVGI